MSNVRRMQSGPHRSRRDFVKKTAALAGTVAAGSIRLERSAHAAGSGMIKIGLIGCGGRGSGAAVNAMNAGDDIKLVAMGDLFEPYARGARDRLKEQRPQQVDVPNDRCFAGFDAYRRVLASDINVVLIAAASHFHPMFLKAAVDAGKHVFCEKPHGLDVPGLKVAMAAAEEAKRKKLALVSGLCWRYDSGVRETMNRVLGGEIGEVVAVQETYLVQPYSVRPRRPEWNEMTYQYQNWYHFNWLSGDQTSQQLIHSLDKGSWALGDRPPVTAWGLGGRQVCVEPRFGDQFDHHAVVFEYANGVRMSAFCRDIPGCYDEVSDVILGTKGRAILPQRPHIESPRPWSYKGPKVNMYDVEHKELFDSIRAGKPLYSGDYMFTSTMLGILAQMACYTGQEITWEKAMCSQRVLGPKSYSFEAEPPVLPDKDGQYPTAMPGVTKFV